MRETTDDTADFRFAYGGVRIRFGDEAVASLADELASVGAERALVVCGRTVGDTPAVMDPVTEGLGDRLAGVFAETTPEKRLETALAGAEAMDARDADAVVGLGGGSSLDAAKAVAVAAASDQDAAALAGAFAETGTLPVPSELPPIVAVPTTLAGADLSQVAGLTADPSSGLVDEPVGGGLGDESLLPSAVVYDTSLFATTPPSVLRGSAMNGFDKGIETLYSHNATAVTDATAARGLRRFREGLLTFADGDSEDADGLPAAVEGALLVQYGISRPDGHTLSLIHSFGHAITAAGTVQQGVAHGVVAPHALRYLFEQVDGRRDLLAEALGVDLADDAVDPADAVVESVADLRDALGLPSRLRDVDGPEPDEFEAVAADVLADSFMENAPAGLDPTRAEIRDVLEAAW